MEKKVYAAGFELFAPNGQERCKKTYELCMQYGFIPYVPGYNPHGKPDTAADETPLTAQQIFDINLEHINGCDVMIAKLDAFRGLEPDSGTAWEVGYAFARGIPVYAYRQDTRPMTEQVGGKTDKDGFWVEDHGSPLNLMLSCSSKLVQGGIEDCLKAMVADGANK